MANPTVLVTGASGLLGTWLRRTAPPGLDVVALGHRRPVDGPSVSADLRDAGATRAAVAGARPDVVLHAAYALDEASIVVATANVAAATDAVGATLVAVSTDAVFPGTAAPCDEATPPEPVHDYGRWKTEAERLVADRLAGRAAVVRLPLLVSLDPPDPAVTRIFTGATERRPTVWFDDELRQPAMAVEVAAALWRIVQLDPGVRSGAWHLPGPELLSRYVIAQRVVAALGLDPGSVTREPTPTSAVRPRRLQLTDERARRAVAWAPSPVLVGSAID